MVSTTRRISQKKKLRNDDNVGTKQVSPKVLFFCKKARQNFLQ